MQPNCVSMEIVAFFLVNLRPYGVSVILLEGTFSVFILFSTVCQYLLFRLASHDPPRRLSIRLTQAAITAASYEAVKQL